MLVFIHVCNGLEGPRGVTMSKERQPDYGSLVRFKLSLVKETKSVTMSIFRKKILFKSFVKVELSYVFTIKMFSTAENCTEK